MTTNPNGFYREVIVPAGYVRVGHITNAEYGIEVTEVTKTGDRYRVTLEKQQQVWAIVELEEDGVLTYTTNIAHLPTYPCDCGECGVARTDCCSGPRWRCETGTAYDPDGSIQATVCRGRFGCHGETDDSD